MPERLPLARCVANKESEFSLFGTIDSYLGMYPSKIRNYFPGSSGLPFRNIVGNNKLKSALHTETEKKKQKKTKSLQFFHFSEAC